MSALLVALVLGITQVVMLAHVRHHLTTAAAEGARYAALVDVTPAAAVAHTASLIEESLSEAYSQDILLESSTELGVPTTRVTVIAPFPALGLWSAGGTFRVSAHAPRHDVPAR